MPDFLKIRHYIIKKIHKNLITLNSDFKDAIKSEEPVGIFRS